MLGRSWGMTRNGVKLLVARLMEPLRRESVMMEHNQKALKQLPISVINQPHNLLVLRQWKEPLVIKVSQINLMPLSFRPCGLLKRKIWLRKRDLRKWVCLKVSFQKPLSEYEDAVKKKLITEMLWTCRWSRLLECLWCRLQVLFLNIYVSCSVFHLRFMFCFICFYVSMFHNICLKFMFHNVWFKFMWSVLFCYKCSVKCDMWVWSLCNLFCEMW